MAGGDDVVEATTSSSIELLLSITTSYACNLSCADDELWSFRSYLRWMCIDQFDAKHPLSHSPSFSSWVSSSPQAPTSSCLAFPIVAPMTYQCWFFLNNDLVAFFYPLQEFITGRRDPVSSNYGGVDTGMRSSYSQLASAAYPPPSSSSYASHSYGGYGSSGLGGYGGYRL
ncbi:hypothetical protein GW17_00016060 [Ensete ventricosum]|nr:hypothetical protein GW17_00016060 [Ensete ventricosum]RZS16628.1 hypothetical protein BHM03_00048652 [Ensete ventricosum]